MAIWISPTLCCGPTPAGAAPVAIPTGTLAVRRLDALMNHVVQNANSTAPIMGLREDIGDEAPYAGGTRYMLGHFHAFKHATHDAR